MKLIAIGRVKDELDIIEPFVRHHAHYFDTHIVLDDGSSDGTYEVLQELDSDFLKRIENGYIRPVLRRLRPSCHVRYAGIGISYREELDGGGTGFGQDFISFFKARGMPKQWATSTRRAHA